MDGGDGAGGCPCDETDDDDVAAAVVSNFLKLLADHRRFRERERDGACVGPPEPVPPPAPGEYRSPAGRHRHRCPNCGTVYEHDDSIGGVRAGHTCPDCRHCPDTRTPLGARFWDKYFGPEPPAYHDPGEKTFRAVAAGAGPPLEKQ